MFLAFNEINHERKKFCLMVSVVALISFLVLTVVGLLDGLLVSNHTAIDQWHADAILMSEEANGNIFASTVDYKTFLEYNEQNAAPINVSRTVAYHNGEYPTARALNIVFMGIDFTSMITPELVAGNYPVNVNEVLVSQSMVNEQNVKIGDTLLISHSGYEYEIVGIVQPAKLNTLPVVYATLEMASPAMLVREELQSSLFINHEHPPTTISAIIFQQTPSQINGNYNQILSINQFINALPGYIGQQRTSSIVSGILIGISAIIVAIFMYFANLQQKDIYNLMHIQGLSSRYLLHTIISEVVMVTLTGGIIGMFFAILIGEIIALKIPFEMRLSSYSLSTTILIIMALIGGILAARRIVLESNEHNK